MRTSQISDWAKDQMVGPIPPESFESNGCTMSPDRWDTVDYEPACHIHDWEYSRGGTEENRKNADRNLRYNMETLGAWIMAGVYFRRVRLWGIWAYNYNPKVSVAKKVWYASKCSVTRWLA